MPKVVEVPGIGNVEFPDSMSDTDVSAQIRKTMASPDPPKAAPGFSDRNTAFWKQQGSDARDLLAGVGSGAISTGVGAYNLARKIPGVDKVLPAPNDYVQGLTQPPDTLAGHTGKFLEQGAEFAAPIGAVNKLTTGARLATKLGAEALTAAGVTGVQTGGDPRAMLESGALVGGIGGVLHGAGPLLGAIGDSSIPGMLREAAEKDYGRVLNATTKGNKLRSARVVPELIDRGIVAPSLKGLGEKVAGMKDQAGQAIGDAFDALPEDTRVPLKPMLDQLAEKSNEAHTVDVGNGIRIPLSAAAQRGMGHVDGIAQTLKDASSVDPATGELGIPVKALRTLRQHFDETSKMAGRFDGKNVPDPSEAAAHGMGADVVRGQIADQFPEIAAANKEYSFASDADRVIQDTLLRRQGQAKPLGVKMLGAAGTAAGFASHGLPGAIVGKMALGTLESAVTSPAWRTVSAVLKDRLADALTKGQRGPAEFAIGKIAQEIEATPKPAAAIEAPAAAEAPAQISAPEATPAIGKGQGEVPAGLPAGADSGSGRTFYHGTSAPEFQTFKGNETYLTTDPNEAHPFSTNPIIGGGRGAGTSRILRVQAAEGKTKSIDNAVMEAIMGDDDIDEAVTKASDQARKEGYSYVTFKHPSSSEVEGSPSEFEATISLHPARDLKITGHHRR